MNYIQKPYPAFGSVVLLLEIEAGLVINDHDVKQGCFVVAPDGTYSDSGDKFVWIVFEGHMRHTNLDTGGVTDRMAGYCSLGVFDSPGTIRVDVVADTKMLCLPPHLRNGIPLEKLSVWRLQKGQSADIPAGTKLLLAHGKMQIADTEISGPRQIRFTSGSKTVAAVSDCYGLLFL
jgi:hypothetical protein